MRQKTVITKLSQSVTEVYYKVHQVLQSVTDCYYKVHQVLQSATVITKLDVTHEKVCGNKDCWGEYTKILELNQYQKSDEALSII